MTGDIQYYPLCLGNRKTAPVRGIGLAVFLIIIHSKYKFFVVAEHCDTPCERGIAVKARSLNDHVWICQK